MKSRVKRIFIYFGKVLTGIICAFLVSNLVDEIDLTWILISVFLVLSPEGNDAMELAQTRIKANFVGAGTGFLLFFLGLPLLAGICIGAFIALVICDLLNLSVGSRSTLAAVTIVLMSTVNETEIWRPATVRVLSVLFGCLIALIATYVFHRVFKVETPFDDQMRHQKPEREA